MDLRRFLLSFSFRKRLPARFGSGRILVTPSADARLLTKGWNGIAFDLMLVADRLIQPGMVAWDIGANQGILSFLAASKVGPDGAVYALEADPAFADLIFRSGQGLGTAYQPITILCAAIAEQSRILEFGVSAKGQARNRLMGYDKSGAHFPVSAIKSVQAVTGDQLLDQWRKPNVVKMDVEGAELAALQGAPRLLSEARPVFYIEVADQNAEAVTDLFKRNDYGLFHLSGDGTERPVDRCTFYTIARPR